ncbi:MAG: SVM family protein [Phytoplasma sp.]|uniref:SVM family protein n=1 Tax=Phytoplasma sp. TaxID=2155 RepID=UPI002B40CCC5|nr:SVM family protein [Phytoplasma sp.]WRH06837.1 MAG: SVM family protein [Phytoplasma sp.]
MVKLKNQFKIFYFYFIIFIGLLFIFNTYQVMALEHENICNQNMQINNIFVEKEEDILPYIIRKNIYQSFSYLTLDYPCYNGDNSKYDLCWRIKNPPHNLLFVVFDKGERYKNDYIYSLEELKTIGNGAENVYIFWLKKKLDLKMKTKNLKDSINKEIFYQLEIKFKEIEIEKLNLKLNWFKENKIKLEKEIDEQTSFYLNTKNHIFNLENFIKELEEIYKNIYLQKKELKQKLNSSYLELKEEKEKYLKLENILEQNKIESLKQQNNINQLTQELNQKTTTCVGIFNSLYKKIF